MRLAELFSEASGRAPTEALEARLQQALRQCREAWPGIEDDEGFASHLGRHRRDDFGAQLTDLYLAWACGRHDPRALELLEARVLSEVGRTVARLKLPDSVQVADVVQRVRERTLLPRQDRGPAILDYEGEGTLLNWLRTAALREVVSRGRRAQPHDDDGALAELPFTAAHPELALARQRFKGPFREAFVAAVAELTNEDKNLMRLSYLDRVPLERLGALFGVHKSTLSRRLEKTRHLLLERTRALLLERFDLAGADVDSLLSRVGHSFEVSLPTTLLDSERDDSGT